MEMAAAVDISTLKSFMECAICLDHFDNPKMLKCNHHFCKRCIEALLHFQLDGSAKVTCPMKCEVETFIEADKTVEDLSLSYEFKGMLEILQKTMGKRSEKDPECTKCVLAENCGKNVSVYCCGEIMCSTCFESHNKVGNEEDHKMKITIAFDKHENKLKVFCDQHASVCSNRCVHGKFLCMYCLQRDSQHKYCSKNTVDVEVTLLKEALVNDSKKRENLMKCLAATKENIQLMRSKYQKLLNEREQQCMTQYADFVKDEKSKLICKIEEMFTNHLGRYPDLTLDDHKGELRKNQIILAIEKDTILDSMISIACPQILSVEKMSLGRYGSDSFLSLTPLGNISVEQGKGIMLNDQPNPTLIELDEAATETEPEESSSSASVIRRRSFNSASVDGTSASSNMVLSRSISFTQNVQAFFDISIGGESAGRIVFELFRSVAPLTCDNFLFLCQGDQGFGYKGSIIHWVDSCGGCCRGGDIVNGDGTGGRSVYGDKFACENYNLRHDRARLVTMVNNGHGYVSSQFYITTKAIPRWDDVHVVFGEVTRQSFHVVERMINVGTSCPYGGKPLQDIAIENSGFA